MFFLISLIFLFSYLLFLLTCIIKGTIQGNPKWILIYIVLFLPFYVTLQSAEYTAFGSEMLVRILQYSKELIFLTFLLTWIGYTPNIFTKKWRISFLDVLFIAFLVLSLIFLILPIGEAQFISKAIYFKNIFLMCLMYFLGRNTNLNFKEWNAVFQLIFLITLVAFFISMFEVIFSKHLHTLIGFSKYNLDLNKIEPRGSYGLTWTFEAQGGTKRFGSLFANPLEFAASMLIPISLAIIYALSTPFRSNSLKYLLILIAALFCVGFAYSRASFVSVFLMMLFIAFLLKYYRLIGILFGAILLSIIYIAFFADEVLRYFVIDTLMFKNSSSLTHLTEWIEGVLSMIEHPMGIGLATSGNAGGVESDIKIGGENQFLVYGVQLGFIGLLLYLLMISKGIFNSWKTFRLSKSREEQIVPFVASSVKFGLLLPLFTANAESYLYISFITWWLIGTSEQTYMKLK